MSQTTYTEQQMIAIGGKLWTVPGKRRVYLDSWVQFIGLEVAGRYNSGNLSHVTLNGQKISNNKARQIGDTIGKIWWDAADGRVHITSRPGYRDRDELVQDIRDGIAEAVAAAQVTAQVTT